MKGAAVLYTNAFESMSRPVTVSWTVTGLRIGGAGVCVGVGRILTRQTHTALRNTLYTKTIWYESN